MKTRKETNKTGSESGTYESNGNGLRKKKMSQQKVKYRHQKHWLEEDDSDYQLPKYKDEEE